MMGYDGDVEDTVDVVETRGFSPRFELQIGGTAKSGGRQVEGER